MANFNIPENPEYTSEVRKFETTDPAHADLFNAVTQVLLNNDTFLKQVTEQLIKNVNQHIKDTENPHEMTAEQLNLEKVDNTSDLEKPVSTVQQNALDALYQQMTQYTDKEIADLINGAPGTLDTLGEIAEAMQENEDVVTALEQAIGIKASKAEMESALAGKLDKTGDAQDNTVTFTSADVADGGTTAWTIVAKLTTSEKLSSVLNKVSVMFKNIRYLYKMLGTTDISAIGGGTVTGAISKLNTDLGGKQNAATAINTSNIGSQNVNYATSAGSATKATQDGNGRNIVTTYLSKSDIGANYGASLTITKSIPNDVETNILSVTIGAAGVYLIHGQANFSSNKTGLRRLEIKNSSGTGSLGGVQMGASESGKTNMQVLSISAATFSANQTVNLYAHQNCGAALNITSAYMSAIRLK